MAKVLRAHDLNPSEIKKVVLDSPKRVSKPLHRTEWRGKPVELKVDRNKSKPPCKCGICRVCKDNARWERIFNEKFADPGYYTQPTVRIGSSLGRGSSYLKYQPTQAGVPKD